MRMSHHTLTRHAAAVTSAYQAAHVGRRQRAEAHQAELAAAKAAAEQEASATDGDDQQSEEAAAGGNGLPGVPGPGGQPGPPGAGEVGP